MADWVLSPGQKIKRKTLHRKFGGNGQSGISPCRLSPNVFFFSDRSSGEQHGYRDEWKTDGFFHYVGEGKRGDQTMTGGNLAILEAAERGRVLRGFQGVGGQVTYEGRFELDKDDPYYTTDAPETDGGPMRTVFVFRLRPIDRTAVPSRTLPPPLVDKVQLVAVEERNTERMVVEPNREPYEAERRESELVQRYKAMMEANGHRARRLMITPAGEAKSIYNDLYFDNCSLLVEAKGGADRLSVRMAIGQLTDYRRFKPKCRCAILLPEKPRQDLIALLVFAGIEIHYADGDKFDVIQPRERGRRKRIAGGLDRSIERSRRQ